MDSPLSPPHPPTPGPGTGPRDHSQDPLQREGELFSLGGGPPAAKAVLPLPLTLGAPRIRNFSCGSGRHQGNLYSYQNCGEWWRVSRQIMSLECVGLRFTRGARSHTQSANSRCRKIVFYYFESQPVPIALSPCQF